MFDFVEQLFHGRPDAKLAECTLQPGSLANDITKTRRITYDDSLISLLEKEHEILLESFGRTLTDGFESGNFTLLCTQLSEFKTLFRNHVLKENVKLFCYLEKLTGNKSKPLIPLRKFRKDINNLSSDVINFCNKFERPIDVLLSQDSFKNEYQTAGRALIHRVQLVESEMYSLYAPD